MTKYKSMSQSELANCAGVNRRTLFRWLLKHKKQLVALGVVPNAKTLPPAAVRYICETFCIDID